MRIDMEESLPRSVFPCTALVLAVAVAVLACEASSQAQGFWPFSSRQEPERSQSSRVTRPREPSSARPSTPRSGTSSAGAAGTASSRSQSSTAITRATVITKPGRYTVTESILGTAEATTATIVVAAADVTLDLGGYLIRGRTSSSPDNCGVAILGDRVRVRNGSIVEYPGENQCGVLVAAGVKDFVLEDVRIGECETGILLNPENDSTRPVQTGRLERCTVTSGSIGILVFPSLGVTLDSCSVSGCVPRRSLEGEGSGAVLRGSGFVVRGCTFTGCTDGLRLEADGSLLLQSVCAGNRQLGCLVGGEGTLVSESSFSANGGDGLVTLEKGTRVESCVAGGNGGQQVVAPEPVAASAAGQPSEVKP